MAEAERVENKSVMAAGYKLDYVAFRLATLIVRHHWGERFRLRAVAAPVRNRFEKRGTAPWRAEAFFAGEYYSRY